jgi:hypothetical protein
MKRLALLMLVLALFAPRIAWAVHLDDHEPLRVETAAHGHHAGHSHDAPSADAISSVASQDRNEGDGDTDSSTHQHPPSILLAFTALLPSDAQVVAAGFELELVPDFPRSGIRIARFDLPDRPPRTA